MSSRSDTIVGALAGGLALAVFGVLGWGALTVVETVRSNEVSISAILVQLERHDTVIAQHDRWLKHLEPSGDSTRVDGSRHR